METTFFVVLAGFTVQNQETGKAYNYLIEAIVRYSQESDSNTVIAYLQNSKNKKGVEVFENFPTNVKEFIIQGGEWRKCTIQELNILDSQN